VPANPGGYIVDLAQVLDAGDEKNLQNQLRELEKETTIQLVVLTVGSLDGENINSFSLRIAEKWRLGQRGKDNGLLLVVALGDHKYRFEVGYGLEDKLPDSMLGTLGRKVLVPYFRRGRYGAGITEAVQALVKILAPQKGDQEGRGALTGKQAGRHQHGLDFSALIFFFLVGVSLLLIYARSVNRKMRRNGRIKDGKGSQRGRPCVGP